MCGVWMGAAGAIWASMLSYFLFSFSLFSSFFSFPDRDGICAKSDRFTRDRCGFKEGEIRFQFETSRL